MLPGYFFHITLTSLVESLITAHGQIPHPGRSSAFPQQSQPQTPNFLVDTDQKISQKNLQTENIPQKHLSGAFPATAFVVDQCTYITLSNCQQIDRWSYPDLPLRKSSGTPGLCTMSHKGESLFIKHVTTFQKAEVVQRCATYLCIVHCITFFFFNLLFLCYAA